MSIIYNPILLDSLCNILSWQISLDSAKLLNIYLCFFFLTYGWRKKKKICQMSDAQRTLHMRSGHQEGQIWFCLIFWTVFLFQTKSYFRKKKKKRSFQHSKTMADSNLGLRYYKAALQREQRKILTMILLSSGYAQWDTCSLATLRGWFQDYFSVNHRQHCRSQCAKVLAEVTLLDPWRINWTTNPKARFIKRVLHL